MGKKLEWQKIIFKIGNKYRGIINWESEWLFFFDALLELLLLKVLMCGKNLEWIHLTAEALESLVDKVIMENPELESVITWLSKKGNRIQLIKKGEFIFEIVDEIEFEEKDRAEIGDFFIELIDDAAKNNPWQTSHGPSESVIELVSGLLEKVEARSIFDPMIRTGAAAFQVALKKGIKEVAGTSLMPEEVRLCKMLAAVYGYTDSLQQIKERVQLADEKSELIVSDFPVDAGRFKNEDFFERVIQQLSEQGIAVLIVNSSTLFREIAGGEERINLLEHNLIDCVIQLPNKLFRNVGIFRAIILLKKNRGRKDILFIDLTEEVGKITKLMTVLSADTISKTALAYENYESIPGFSAVVQSEEVLKQQGNLSPGIYIEEKVEREENLESIEAEIKRLQQAIASIQERIEALT